MSKQYIASSPNISMARNQTATGVARFGKGALVATLVGAAACAHASATDYHYAFTAGNITATGTITTDGTIGTLTEANIHSASVSILSGTDITAFTATQAGGFATGPSVFGVTGGLSATADGLYFDYVGSHKALWIEQGSGGFTGVVWAANQNGCAYGGYGNCIWLNTFVPTAYATQSGIQKIADVSAVPEPASYALLLTGFGLMGVVSRQRKTRLSS